MSVLGSMRWLVCAVLAMQLSASADEGRGIRVLSASADPTARARETVLVEALRIYTRDLGRTVKLGGAPPGSLAPSEVDRLADDATRAGDEMLVWFGERDGAPALLALRTATRELRSTRVEPDAPERAARTLALKVRALLSARTAPQEWSTPVQAPAPGPVPDEDPAFEWGPEGTRFSEPARAPAPPAQASSPASPPASSPQSSIVRRPPAAPRRAWLEATVAYDLTVPTQLAWLRQGLSVRLAFPWGRLPWLAYVDAAFDNAPSTTTDGNLVTARVWPVGLGVDFRLRRPRWQLRVGPRASLQIVDASSSSPDGRTGSARVYSAGLGARVEGAWLFSRWVGATASLSAEALVPRLAFAAGGSGTTDLGWVQLGFTAGFLFRVP
jgi:hypothetical protein